MLDDPITGKHKSRNGIILGLVVILIIMLFVLFAFPFQGNQNPISKPPKGTSPPANNVSLVIVNITLSNAQSTATPVNFDQKLGNFDWVQYYSYLNANLSNVAFYSSPSLKTSNELHAWVESNASSADAHSTVWVNLSTNVVPANGNLTIFMIIRDKNATFSQYFGEAPTLSPSYGLHDNGKYVFPFYDNFQGVSLNTTNWQVINGGGGIYSVDNGITISEGYLITDMRIVSVNRYSGIVDGMVTQQDFYSYRGTGIELATVLPTQTNVSTYDYGFNTGYRFFASDNHPAGTVGGFIDTDVAGNESTIAHNVSNPLPAPYLMTVEWPRTGLEIWLNNYSSYLNATNNSINATSTYISLYAGADHSNIGTISFSFVRVRPFPPNNVMPSVMVGNTYLQPITVNSSNVIHTGSSVPDQVGTLSNGVFLSTLMIMRDP